jgi:hypothetical protein
MGPANRGNLSQIAQGITSTTMRYVALMRYIQSTSHHQSPTPTVAEKSSWWCSVNPQQAKPQRRLPDKLRWPEKPTRRPEKDTEVGKMTRGHPRMKPMMVPPPRGHHPMFNQQRPVGRDRLRDQSRMLHEEIKRIEWQGEQVYRTPTHNALSSQVIIYQLTPLLPKDSEEVNA